MATPSTDRDAGSILEMTRALALWQGLIAATLLVAVANLFFRGYLPIDNPVGFFYKFMLLATLCTLSVAVYLFGTILVISNVQLSLYRQFLERSDGSQDVVVDAPSSKPSYDNFLMVFPQVLPRDRIHRLAMAFLLCGAFFAFALVSPLLTIHTTDGKGVAAVATHPSVGVSGAVVRNADSSTQLSTVSPNDSAALAVLVEYSNNTSPAPSSRNVSKQTRPLADILSNLAALVSSGLLSPGTADTLRETLLTNSIEGGKEILVETAKAILSRFLEAAKSRREEESAVPKVINVNVSGCCISQCQSPAERKSAPVPRPPTPPKPPNPNRQCAPPQAEQLLQ